TILCAKRTFIAAGSPGSPSILSLNESRLRELSLFGVRWRSCFARSSASHNHRCFDCRCELSAGRLCSSLFVCSLISVIPERSQGSWGALRCNGWSAEVLITFFLAVRKDLRQAAYQRSRCF